MGLPSEPIVRQPLEQPARRPHLVIEVGEQTVFDRHRRSLFRSLLCVLLLVAGSIGACRRAEAPPPPLTAQTSGTLQLFGLSAPVRVVRDRAGIPHIHAESRDDLFFAQGFVQAQDRLFQMDLWRRAAQGRLAEVLGPNFAERDAMTRRLQARVDPAADWARADPDAIAIARAFVRGINTWVARARAAPPEAFALAGWKPDLWSPEDLLNRTDAFVGSRDAVEEIFRARLVDAVGLRAARSLDDTVGGLPPGLDPATLSPVVADAIRSVGAPPFFLGLAKPVRGATSGPLDRDVPLDARTAVIPSRRYLVHLSAPGLNAIGATAPWLPGVASGHNARVAWDVEPAIADTQDVYVEQLNPANRHQVDDNGRWSDTTIVKDTLAIRGRAAPFAFDREYTRHGVIVAVDRERHLAFVVRWSGVEAGAAAGLTGLALLRAASSGDVRAAIENWRTPPERVSYADVAGDRGVEVAGIVPVRRGSSGSLPSPAWNGANDWIDWARPAAAGEERPLARLARLHPDRADALIAELRRIPAASADRSAQQRALVDRALADAARMDGTAAPAVMFVHPLAISAAARRRFDIGPLSPSSPRAPTFAVACVPADWDRSTAIAAPGQSESPDSAHYADLARVWASGGSIPLPFTDAAVQRETESMLLLVPGVDVHR
jgi:acyl-homoserine lactone acylase PvdQ